MLRARIQLPGATFAVALAAVLLLAGCWTAGKWTYVTDKPSGKDTTTVTIRSVPEGAEIHINGNYVGEANLKQDIRYPYRVKVYQRRQYIPYLHIEEKDHRIYQRNDFTISAYLVGYEGAEQMITLTGQETLDVTFRLVKKPE